MPRMPRATRRRLLAALPAFVEHVGETDEPVGDSVVARALNRHPRRAHLDGVRLALIAQRIVTGGLHQRGRQPGKIARHVWACVGIRAIAGAGQIMVPEPFHVGARQHEAVGGEFALRRRVIRRGDRGIEQQLEAQRRTAAVPRHDRNHGREISARAVAAHGYPARIGAERRGVGSHPPGRGVAILGRCGKLVLRSEPIIDRHQHASRRVCNRAAQDVVGIDTAEHPSAAVEIHQRAHRSRSGGGVDANRNCAMRTVYMPVFGAIDRWRLDLARLQQRHHLRARLLGRLRA
jgi:hypothetical protein